MFLRRVAAWIAVLAFGAVAFASDARQTLRKAKIRSGPGVYYPVVVKIDEGEKLSVLKDGDPWIKVKTTEGKQGWVSKKAFKKREKSSGYGKVLQENGLAGASTTVVTMAARGLTPSGMSTTGATDSLLYDYLMKSAFRPEGFGDFLKELKPGSCQAALQEVGGKGMLPGDSEADELERSLGLALAVRVMSENTLLTDPVVDDYVNKVGMAVAQYSSRYDLSWRFVVLQKKEADAFPVPGGFVFVTTGLLERLADEAELAAVLGHQVAHLVLGHGAKELAEATRKAKKGDFDGLCEKAYRLLRAPQSKQYEHPADALGMVLASCAGYDPGALGRVYSKLSSFESVSTQPPVKERIAHMKRIRNKAHLPGGATLKSRFEKAQVSSR